MIEIKQLLNKEKEEALTFIKEVYLASKDDSYTEEGTKSFLEFIKNKNATKSFKVYGAFEDENLKGVLASDRRKRYINFFFVDKNSQGKGIGKKLMEHFLNENDNLFIMVNSSRYAVPVYEKLGFIKVEEEKIQEGLVFTPMKFEIKK